MKSKEKVEHRMSEGTPLFDLEAEKPKAGAERIAQLRATLYSNLWAIADELRGRMDSSNFKNYMLGVIFYKNLSDRTELEVADLLKNEPEEFRSYSRAWENEDYRDEIRGDLLSKLGYVVEPQNLFSTLLAEVKKGTSGSWHIDLLATAFSQITESTIGHESQEDFNGLFSAIDLNSPSLGKNLMEKSDLMGRVLLRIAAIDFSSHEAEIDLLGDAYEYLIGKFASDAGKSGGEFYTPQEVSTLMARLVAAKNPDLRSVYDPTCGSASLLFRVEREVARVDGERIKDLILHGQELNIETYNLARMNLILHQVPWQNFKVYNGDTLAEDLHEGTKYDAIVANPPYSTKWKQPPTVGSDPRFAPAGALAPPGKADLAFVQHIVHHLAEPESEGELGGIAAVVLPVGILYRGAKEAVIRRWLVEQNLVDAIIGLPGGIFNAGVTTLVLVLRKGRVPESPTRFIDASQDFVKTKNLNIVTQESIEKILDHYASKSMDAETGETVYGRDEEGYSRLVPMSEIRENEHSLQINLYVSKPRVNDLPSYAEVTALLTANQAELEAAVARVESLRFEFEESE